MRQIIIFSVAALILLVLSGCAVHDMGNLDPSFYGKAIQEPSVQFTYFPPAYTGSYVQGIVTNIDSYTNYKLCLWIYVPGWGWVPKPYYATPFTAVQPNGSWTTTFYTGGHDYDATYMIMYLLRADYPSYADIYTLANDCVTYTVLNRPDAASGAVPQMSATNTTNDYMVVYDVHDTTNITIVFRASDDYYLDGVGIAQEDSPLKFYKTDRPSIFTQVTNCSFEFNIHSGSNRIRYFAKDQGTHISTTNTLIVYCPPLVLPVMSCSAYFNPYIFVSPAAITGTAWSEAGISAICVFTNGVPLPITVTNMTNWSSTITLDPEIPLTLSMYCLDTYGVSSVTQSQAVYFGLNKPWK